jgi:hypothetical protein
MVLSRVFGTKRIEIKGYDEKLHNEELQNLHSLPNILIKKF